MQRCAARTKKNRRCGKRGVPESGERFFCHIHQNLSLERQTTPTSTRKSTKKTNPKLTKKLEQRSSKKSEPNTKLPKKPAPNPAEPAKAPRKRKIYPPRPEEDSDEDKPEGDEPRCWDVIMQEEKSINKFTSANRKKRGNIVFTIDGEGETLSTCLSAKELKEAKIFYECEEEDDESVKKGSPPLVQLNLGTEGTSNTVYILQAELKNAQTMAWRHIYLAFNRFTEALISKELVHDEGADRISKLHCQKGTRNLLYKIDRSKTK